MTVISEGIFDQQKFYKNSKKNKGEEVIWKGVNLNTPEVCELMLELADKRITITDFLSLLVEGKNYIENHTFLFCLTSVARHNLDFISYCKIVGIFSTNNKKYKRKYQSARMFKNI